MRAIEILDAFEFGHAFERAIEAVIPAVIRAMQNAQLTAGLGYHRSGVMAADVEEGAQDTVVTADYNDGLTCNHSGDELSRGLHLIGTRHQLPRFAEHAEALKFGDARIDVPRGRNG